MTNFDSEPNLLANKAQIYEITINNSFLQDSESSIPRDLWQRYFRHFKWLVYRGGILQCLTCQEAYQKFPIEIECDEWTNPSDRSYQPLKRHNVIILLKLHNFSDNHIRASELLNIVSEENEICSLNQSIENHFVSLKLSHAELDKYSEQMVLLRMFKKRHFQESVNDSVVTDCVIDLVNDNEDISQGFEPLTALYSHVRSSSYNPWGRYLTRYPWLYLKDDNPGCKYCEHAFKLSLQMSFTKWTSPNMLAETVSQDRPNRTLLQHDRSKNHRIAEDVLVEHKIITPPPASPQSKAGGDMKQEKSSVMEYFMRPLCQYPPDFNVERWDRFTSSYAWLYYQNGLFHCTYCERAFTMHRNRMTHTSWTSSQFDSARIKDVSKARHYFYDHQRSNNHRVARNILQLEGIISTKSSVADDEYNEEELSEEEEDIMKPLSPYEDALDKVLNDKQWQQLSLKYPWLEGAMGKSYGCSACQQGRKLNPLTVNLSQWTQGQIPFTKTKYIQLRKSLWCHSITRNHINAVSVLQLQITASIVTTDHFDETNQSQLISPTNHISL